MGLYVEVKRSSVDYVQSIPGLGWETNWKEVEEIEENILVFFMSIADSRKFDIKR